MSLMGNNFGGQCPSHQLTVRDKLILGVVGIALLVLILGIMGWAFGSQSILYAMVVIIFVGYVMQKGGA